jgi:hypothetical protein
VIDDMMTLFLAAIIQPLLLLQVLSYHIIPGMLRSSQLTERQALQTSLAGAAPLIVKVSSAACMHSTCRVLCLLPKSRMALACQQKFTGVAV